ncbi:hypothetical protein RHSIM_Rhsim11G0102300 [Rhododendron simsii]|uniref:Uncharacterized protein n=1 Tax=Rhododendron simsii TaxID=118357 RepID=A0A834G7R7_RHOSS|nr:hypothetical protein RHSIM_Rhsim11G0102300 [Rhododendron simsii]
MLISTLVFPPLGEGIGRRHNFLLQKVLPNMQEWKMKLLSQARRELLIKAVVNLDDQVDWHFDCGAVYLLKSDYLQALDMPNAKSSSAPPPFSLRYSCGNTFGSGACLKLLAAKDDLEQKEAVFTNTYPISGNFEESVKRFLFHWEWIKAGWFESSMKYKLKKLAGLRRFGQKSLDLNLCYLSISKSLFGYLS